MDARRDHPGRNDGCAGHRSGIVGCSDNDLFQQQICVWRTGQYCQRAGKRALRAAADAGGYPNGRLLGVELSTRQHQDRGSDITRPIHVSNNDNSSYADCISNVDYKQGTDILTVRHASSTTVAENDIVGGDVYLHTSLTSGALFIADTDGTVDAGIDVGELPVTNHHLTAHAYYVRPWSQTVGDGIPILARKAINGTSVVAEPLAEYVEDLQVTLGLDMDWDGNVDRYDNNGITAAETDHVMTVIVELLIRAPTGEADYTNDKIYQLGDRAGFTPADNFRRQVFRETIFIRNWTGLGSV